MQTFNQEMPQGNDIKLEVSDSFLNECDHLEDESSDSATLKDNINDMNCGSDFLKRGPCDEQDSSHDSNTPGSPLPPRKRAKTQEEKEQRRIERIMRNRQAAHASREKKRKHLEMLEAKCAQLECENKDLRASQTNVEYLKLRLQQLETAVKAAQSSGDLESLGKILQEPVSSFPTQTVNSSPAVPPTNNTMSGAVLQQSRRPSNVGGSPAPSLVDDCASPDALVIKAEEDSFLSPHSPEKSSIDADLDIYGMMNFNFDSNLSTSAGTLTFSESSSKSRHPAVLTPLSVEPFTF